MTDPLVNKVSITEQSIHLRIKFLISIEVDKKLIFATDKSLRQISLDNDEWIDIDLLTNKPINLITFDLHYKSGRLFYVDQNFKQIRSLSFFRSTRVSSESPSFDPVLKTRTKILINDNLKKPSSIVVDQIAENLYWSDEERHLIEVSRLDGSSRKILIDLDLNGPRCLEILPSLGLLFFVNYETSPAKKPKQKIERGIIESKIFSVISCLILSVRSISKLIWMEALGSFWSKPMLGKSMDWLWMIVVMRIMIYQLVFIGLMVITNVSNQSLWKESKDGL